MFPDVLEGVGSVGGLALVFFRLAAFALTGVFTLAVGRSITGVEEGYALDEDGSMLLEKVSDELGARRGEQLGVILVDPGRQVEDVDLLMERVRARIGEPILLGEGTVFGVVLSEVDERALESASRRALAAASSLGAEETRAGAANLPARCALSGRSAGRRRKCAGGGLRDRKSQRHRPRRSRHGRRAFCPGRPLGGALPKPATRFGVGY